MEVILPRLHWVHFYENRAQQTFCNYISYFKKVQVVCGFFGLCTRNRPRMSIRLYVSSSMIVFYISYYCMNNITEGFSVYCTLHCLITNSTFGYLHFLIFSKKLGNVQWLDQIMYGWYQSLGKYDLLIFAVE